MISILKNINFLKLLAIIAILSFSVINCKNSYEDDPQLGHEDLKCTKLYDLSDHIMKVLLFFCYFYFRDLLKLLINHMKEEIQIG